MKNVPPPNGPTGGPLRALIYDSVYDEYKVCRGDGWCGVVWCCEMSCDVGVVITVAFVVCRACFLLFRAPVYLAISFSRFPSGGAAAAAAVGLRYGPSYPRGEGLGAAK